MSIFLNLKKHIFLPFIMLLSATPSFTKIDKGGGKQKTAHIINDNFSLYCVLHLQRLGLAQEVFEKAIVGWNDLNLQQKLQHANLLSILDLSQSSNAKRLYVIDMVKKEVIFNTYAAHGRNSGGEYAKFFGNQNNSHKSSLGFYVTGETYNGAHGLSMRLKGMEKGINDEAESRGIVMHGANYVSENFIKQCGRLGRSQGCPAVPAELCTVIVNIIKEGSCFFMYYPDKHYLSHSILV